MQINTLPFKRLLIVSYRLPFTLKQTDDGYKLVQNAGGLVSAVLSMAGQMGHTPSGEPDRIHWVGHAASELQSVPPEMLENEAFVAHPVFLDEEVHRGFYEGFSNDLLWPLFHYFPSYASFNEYHFEQYQEANARFRDVLDNLIEPGDLVWIHDFQLMLLPERIRQRHPSVAIGYFFHIPFPTYEIVKLLPRNWRQELLRGVLGADVVGFHTTDYVQHFMQSVMEVLALPIIGSRIVLPNRSIEVREFPISIDFHKFNASSRHRAVIETQHRYRALLRHNKLIFSVDRLDYTKGILYRLQGYERFLLDNPDWRDRVTFVMTVVPSRDQITQYQELKREIEETVGRINGLVGSIGWRPIVYVYSSLTFVELMALYTACDVALITPIRDGMNLVCKEFVASRRDAKGVLILSELAGAAQELTQALLVNPTDTQEVAEAIKAGLTMPPAEQEWRMLAMRKHLQNHTVFRWSQSFLQTVEDRLVRATELETDLAVPAFLSAFTQATQQLLLLDFDGTLAPIVDDPAMAQLSEHLKTTLSLLARQTDVVVISGRNRAFLETIFTDMPVYLVAEHGAFLRKPTQSWTRLDLSTDDWVADVQAVMQQLVERLPGSFIEQKETAIVWHYRMLDDEIGESTANELSTQLRRMSFATPITIIQGSKVVEVKPALHSKGTVALAIVEQKTYDFIVSIGDDTTDEDMFRLLPNWSYTLKVGAGVSFARYRLARQPDVEALLVQMANALLAN